MAVADRQRDVRVPIEDYTCGGDLHTELRKCSDGSAAMASKEPFSTSPALEFSPFALLAMAAEFLGPIGVALGFLTRIASFGIRA